MDIPVCQLEDLSMRLGYFPTIFSPAKYVFCCLFLWGITSIGTTQDAHQHDSEKKVERSADLNRETIPLIICHFQLASHR